MLYLQLFYEFFKIGSLSFGGGYATIPFLYHISQTYQWFTPDDLEKMIAIASITPGPVGMNMATFSGLQTSGIVGSLIATAGIAIPALIIVIFVSKLLNKFSDNFYVKAAIYGSKPASCALLASVAINLMRSNIINIPAAIIFVLFLLISLRIKKDPLFYLASTGLIGFIFKYMNLI